MRKFTLSREAKQEIKETIKWTAILFVFTCWPAIVSIIRCIFGF